MAAGRVIGKISAAAASAVVLQAVNFYLFADMLLQTSQVAGMRTVGSPRGTGSAGAGSGSAGGRPSSSTRRRRTPSPSRAASSSASASAGPGRAPSRCGRPSSRPRSPRASRDAVPPAATAVQEHTSPSRFGPDPTPENVKARHDMAIVAVTRLIFKYRFDALQQARHKEMILMLKDIKGKYGDSYNTIRAKMAADRMDVDEIDATADILAREYGPGYLEFFRKDFRFEESFPHDLQLALCGSNLKTAYLDWLKATSRLDEFNRHDHPASADATKDLSDRFTNLVKAEMSEILSIRITLPEDEADAAEVPGVEVIVSEQGREEKRMFVPAAAWGWNGGNTHRDETRLVADILPDIEKEVRWFLDPSYEHDLELSREGEGLGSQRGDKISPLQVGHTVRFRVTGRWSNPTLFGATPTESLSPEVRLVALQRRETEVATVLPSLERAIRREKERLSGRKPGRGVRRACLRLSDLGGSRGGPQDSHVQQVYDQYAQHRMERKKKAKAIATVMSRLIN
ncbi:unnamed protein product [Amoebophrya sp. A120]|nr:unnamed protein product [Amoebophrya sp. A120]|eukprot:GSA120T00026022001.1